MRDGESPPSGILLKGLRHYPFVVVALIAAVLVFLFVYHVGTLSSARQGTSDTGIDTALPELPSKSMFNGPVPHMHMKLTGMGWLDIDNSSASEETERESQFWTHSLLDEDRARLSVPRLSPNNIAHLSLKDGWLIDGEEAFYVAPGQKPDLREKR